MSAAPHPFLRQLGLDADADERAVRRAYARQLKQIDQEADPAAFQALREAYEAALRWVRDTREQGPSESPPAAAPDPPPEAASPAAEPPDAPSHAADTPALPVVDDADTLARAVFADFCQALEAAPPATGTEARRALDDALGDERLLQLDARDFFEGGVAHLLSSGWRPGHEFLFPAALACFHWGTDPRRLSLFGGMGRFIDAAIVEQIAREADPPAARQYQDQLIQQLRGRARPDARTLITDMGIVDDLVARFPHWASIHAPREQVFQWREWAGEPMAPGPRPRPATPVAAAATESNRVPSFVWWMLLMSIVGLGKILGSTPTPTPAPMPHDRPAPQALAPAARPPSPDFPGQSFNDNLGTGRAAHGQGLPENPLLDGAARRTVFPPTVSAPSITEIPPDVLKALTKKKPTTERCGEAAGWLRRLDPQAQSTPAFDRLIVNCLLAKLWPRSTDNTMVLKALDRERRRSELEMKRLLAEAPRIVAPKPVGAVPASRAAAPTKPFRSTGNWADDDPLGVRQDRLPPADYSLPQGSRFKVAPEEARTAP